MAPIETFPDSPKQTSAPLLAVGLWGQQWMDAMQSQRPAQFAAMSREQQEAAAREVQSRAIQMFRLERHKLREAMKRDHPEWLSTFPHRVAAEEAIAAQAREVVYDAILSELATPEPSSAIGMAMP